MVFLSTPQTCGKPVTLVGLDNEWGLFVVGSRCMAENELALLGLQMLNMNVGGHSTHVYTYLQNRPSRNRGVGTGSTDRLFQ